MIIINLSCYAFLSLWGCIGISRDVPVGLKMQWEMFVFAFLHGLNLGAVQV